MNQLKAGQILRIPRATELREVSPGEALQEVRVHAADWNSYRNNLAQAVAQSAPEPAAAQPQASGGRIAGAAEDRAAPPPAGPRDVVKLSKSETPTGAAAAPAGAASDDKLRALEEEATAQERAIAEVNERIAFFEKQIQDMQKLLQIQNEMLAELQKGAVPPGASEQQAPASVPPDPQAQAPAVQQQPQSPAPAAKPAPQPRPPAEPTPEPSLIDTLLENSLLLAGLGGLLALLLGLWLYIRNKRRKNLDNFEKGILTSSGLKTDTVFGTTASAVDTGDTSFLTDFSHRNSGMIDTSDVDPISEAEVYMAYGRDAQAEEILKDAIAKEPKRYELHLKLLEIYANRKDAVTFETLASELYPVLGANDPTWHKIAEMGRRLEPENPLYAAGGGAPAPTGSASEGTGAAIAAAAGAAVAMGAMEADAASRQPDAEDTSDNSLDFDLGMLEEAESPTGAPAPEKEGEGDEPRDEFPRLDTFDLPETREEVAAQPEPVETMPGLGIDFDLPAQEPPTEKAPEKAADFDVPELHMPSADTDAAEEEAARELLPSQVADTPASEEGLELPDLEWPQSESGATPAAVPEPAAEEGEEQIEEISLDLPELTLPESTAVPTEQEEKTAAFPSFAFPSDETAETPQVADTPSKAEHGPAVSSVPEDIQTAEDNPFAAFDLSSLELPRESDSSLEAAEEMQREEAAGEPAAEENKLDFNFDLELPPAAAEPAESEPASPLPDLDLSGISLDIGGGEESEAPTEEITLSSGESPDVDTKLDLVTAYMDMGDSEGARELLEEVLQEGGPQQRERARQLLESLG